MYRHLIFDLDGTIIDTITSIAIALNQTLKHFNKKYSYDDKTVATFLGHGTPYLLNKALKGDDSNISEIMKYFINKQINIHLRHAKRYKGLITALRYLKARNVLFYIATNKPEDVAIPIINKLYGNGFFVEVIAQNEKTPKKPDPTIVNRIIDKYHLKRNECLYVGDSYVDIETARNAKIDSCLVLYGYGNYDKINKDAVDLIISEPKDFKKIWK